MRIHTISRSTGKSRIWQITAAFFSYYIVNCFDDQGERGSGVCIDAIAFKVNPSIVDYVCIQVTRVNEFTIPHPNASPGMYMLFLTCSCILDILQVAGS